MTKSWYISTISNMSDRYGNYLVELMDKHKVQCLADIAKEQAKNFYNSLSDQTFTDSIST